MTSKRSLSRLERDQRSHVALSKAVKSLKRNLTLDEVNGHATALRLVAQFASLTTLPMGQHVDRKAAQRELQQAAQKADEFAKALHALSRNAHDAYRAVWQQQQQEGTRERHGATNPAPLPNLVPGHADPVMLKDAVLEFAVAASSAHDLVIDTNTKRLRKPQSREVTRTACKIYEKVTGQPAARRTDPYRDGKPCGPFHSFLIKVFAALRLKASADAQIKSLLES